MTNPYQLIARKTLATLKGLEKEQQVSALALVLAQVTVQAQRAQRSRVQVLESFGKYERATVEALDNAPHYLQIETAKRLGMSILENKSVVQLKREQTDTDVTYTATVALVPTADWES